MQCAGAGAAAGVRACPMTFLLAWRPPPTVLNVTLCEKAVIDVDPGSARLAGGPSRELLLCLYGKREDVRACARY